MPSSSPPAHVAHHHGSGNQITQPLGTLVGQDADRPRHPASPRLQVHDPDEIAKHGALEGEWLATYVHHPQPDRPLARRAPAPEPLEEQEVSPLDEKNGEDEEGAAHGIEEAAQAAGVVDRQAEQQHSQDENGQVDGQGGRARTDIGEHIVEADVLGGVHRDMAVERL